MSTIDAFKCLPNIIYKALDKNKPLIKVFIDLLMAFDTVDLDHILLQ